MKQRVRVNNILDYPRNNDDALKKNKIAMATINRVASRHCHWANCVRACILVHAAPIAGGGVSLEIWHIFIFFAPLLRPLVCVLLPRPCISSFVYRPEIALNQYSRIAVLLCCFFL